MAAAAVHAPALSGGWSPRKTLMAAALLLVLLTCVSYFPLLGNKFVIYDDPEYITENVQVRAGLTLPGVRWAFTSLEQRNWHPLTWLSHMLDVTLFGLNPAGHHATSLLLHIANSLLLLVTLRTMTGAVWRSFLVASLFAVHPLHVESVAWAAERKDLLCGLFWFLSLFAYHHYVQRPSWRRYLLLVAAFVAGLLSKPMMVTLPCVLLLLDYWPLRRSAGLVSLVLEKVPLLLLSAGCSAITYRAQAAEFRSGVTVDTAALMNGIQSFAVYLYKAVWPLNLAVLYPFDLSKISLLRTGAALLLLAAATLTALVAAKRRPYLPVGWLWYLGTLVPVVGLVRVGFQSIADRYTYIPFVGLFLLVSWGLADLVGDRAPVRRLAVAICVVIVGACGLLTFRQVQRWENTLTLMTSTIAATDNNWFAYNTLGCAYLLIGTHNRQVHIADSLPLYPDTPERRIRYLKKAVEAFSTSASLYPSYLPARNNLQLATTELQRFESAEISSGTEPVRERIQDPPLRR